MKKVGNSTGISCARCGACLATCPVYQVTLHERFSPRARWELISYALSADAVPVRRREALLETLRACLQCGACSDICPAGADVCQAVRNARSGLIFEQGLPLWFKGALNTSLRAPGLTRLIQSLPRGAGLVRRFAAFFAKKSPYKRIPNPARIPVVMDRGLRGLCASDSRHAKIVLFTGCLQNYVYKDVVKGMINWFGEGSVYIPEDQVCCGLSAYSSGEKELASHLARKNLDILSMEEGQVIVTGCASCASMIRTWPKLFKKDDPVWEKACQVAENVKEFTEYVVEGRLIPHRPSFRAFSKVVLHVPCHQRFSIGASRSPWFLLKGIYQDSVSLLELCCGQGGSFALECPEISEKIFQRAHSSLLDTDSAVKAVFTTCSGCLLQWDLLLPEGSNRPVVLHPAQALL